MNAATTNNKSRIKTNILHKIEMIKWNRACCLNTRRFVSKNNVVYRRCAVIVLRLFCDCAVPTWNGKKCDKWGKFLLFIDTTRALTCDINKQIKSVWFLNVVFNWLKRMRYKKTRFLVRQSTLKLKRIEIYHSVKLILIF